MKVTVTLMTTVVMAMFTGIHQTAASQLEGFWFSSNTGVSIEVQDTYDGIKVKRTDRDRWRYYDSRRNGAYKDAQGNTYKLTRRNRLEWSARNGRQTIRFERGYGSDGYNDYADGAGYGDREGYYNDPYYDDSGGLGGVHQDGSYCPAGFTPHGKHHQMSRAQLRRLRALEGRWSNWYSDSLLRIRVNRKAVHVDHNGRHLHFYPAGHGRLVSDSGITMFTSGRNRLVWKSRRGRTINFTRGRTNNNYCE